MKLKGRRWWNDQAIVVIIIVIHLLNIGRWCRYRLLLMMMMVRWRLWLWYRVIWVAHILATSITNVIAEIYSRSKNKEEKADSWWKRSANLQPHLKLFGFDIPHMHEGWKQNKNTNKYFSVKLKWNIDLWEIKLIFLAFLSIPREQWADAFRYHEKLTARVKKRKK